jgi:uncharacterized protein YcgL (UPF0745 family)
MSVTRCFIYKSPRKADTYVYVPKADAFDALPQALAHALGPLVFVMELELTPGRRLARADASQVIAALAQEGFYLQLPPADPLLAPPA